MTMYSTSIRTRHMYHRCIRYCLVSVDNLTSETVKQNEFLPHQVVLVCEDKKAADRESDFLVTY